MQILVVNSIKRPSINRLLTQTILEHLAKLWLSLKPCAPTSPSFTLGICLLTGKMSRLTTI